MNSEGKGGVKGVLKDSSWALKKMAVLLPDEGSTGEGTDFIFKQNVFNVTVKDSSTGIQGLVLSEKATRLTD